MCFEIVLNGNRIRNIDRAEELLQVSGLSKSGRFDEFCGIIAGVETLIGKMNGNIDRIIYDYDEKSGTVKCCMDVFHAEAGNTIDLFRYMIEKVDVFEVEPSMEGLSLSFVMKDIFEEELCHTA